MVRGWERGAGIFYRRARRGAKGMGMGTGAEGSGGGAEGSGGE